MMWQHDQAWHHHTLTCVCLSHECIVVFHFIIKKLKVPKTCPRNSSPKNHESCLRLQFQDTSCWVSTSGWHHLSSVGAFKDTRSCENWWSAAGLCWIDESSEDDQESNRRWAALRLMTGSNHIWIQLQFEDFLFLLDLLILVRPTGPGQTHRTWSDSKQTWGFIF